jgi:hypothetical protein
MPDAFLGGLDPARFRERWERRFREGVALGTAPVSGA